MTYREEYNLVAIRAFPFRLLWFWWDRLSDRLKTATCTEVKVTWLQTASKIAITRNKITVAFVTKEWFTGDTFSCISKFPKILISNETSRHIEHLMVLRTASFLSYGLALTTGILWNGQIAMKTGILWNGHLPLLSSISLSLFLAVKNLINLGWSMVRGSGVSARRARKARNALLLCILDFLCATIVWRTVSLIIRVRCCGGQFLRAILLDVIVICTSHLCNSYEWN